ncbi:MAG: NADH:flavin oxidoreductase [Proteobacteria bacterium]|nr:NADH:flavin oxidoreductase [Pseudomonadota bacterium]
MAEYDALLQPFQIKHLTIRNRIMSTSHAPGYNDGGMPAEREQLYYEEKARGGVGLNMFGGSSAVSLDNPSTFGQLDLADDRVIPFLRQMADRIHSHGAAAFCQISHAGRRTRWDIKHWLPSVAPSHIRETEHRVYPKKIEDWDLERICEDFGQGARRVKEGGLDGVELLFAGSHLALQFFSPAANTRTDEYGGSLENRMRFAFEAIDAVRGQVGEDFILGIRITADEFIANGLSQDDCLEIAVRLAESGKIDYLNIMASQVSDWRGSSLSIPNMSFPVVAALYLASAIRAAVDIPIFHAGRIPDLATAARAIEEGHLDMVAMTRPHIADPHIVTKLKEGRVDDIRQCVGANYCINRIYVGKESLCIQNPATSREAKMPHIVPPTDGPRKKVVVVGAGVGGLEAARVSALRGHEVVVFEAEDRTGGQVNIASRATWRESLSGIPRWLDQQARKAGADIRLNTPASAESVMAEAPDIVVIATGGTPNKGPIKGIEHAVSSWDILTGKAEPGETVLLFDANGDHHGPSVAEVLSERGSRVEVVTPDRFVGEDVGVTDFAVHYKRLYAKGVVKTSDYHLAEVYPEGNRIVAVLRNAYTDEEEERVVDQVVSEGGIIPREELYEALKPHSRNLGALDLHALVDVRPQTIERNPEGKFALYRVGDAVAGRNIHAAIYDSLRLCVVF